MTTGTPQSPCVSICALDEDDICIGCFRSAEEITEWMMADDAGKQAIIDKAADRRNAAGLVLF